jgi:hypothetical protein
VATSLQLPSQEAKERHCFFRLLEIRFGWLKIIFEIKRGTFMDKFFKKLIFAFVFVALTSFALSAEAHAGDGFQQVFKIFFGSEGARKKSVTCDLSESESGQGLLQIANLFFCELEKDFKITGPNVGVTKIFGKRSVRAIVTAGPFTVNGVIYSNQAQVWVCTVSCSSVNGFNRAINVYFSYNANKAVNKGDMLIDTGAFTTTLGQNGLHLVYDVGTLTATQTMLAQAVYIQNSSIQKLRMESSRTGNILGLTGVMVVGPAATASNSHRFAAQLNTITNSGGAYFEVPSPTSSSGLGIFPVNLASSSDSKTMSSACIVRMPDGRDDWTYLSTKNIGCAVRSFPAETATVVGDYTISSVLTGTSFWNGMTANPGSI